MKNYKWTVFFLMRVEDSVLAEATAFLQDLLEVEISDDIAIILCVNINKYSIKRFLSGVPGTQAPDGPEKMTTVFYRILSSKNEAGKCHSAVEFIYEKRNFDITNEDDVSYYFKQFVLRNHDADRYMLFTWDHGNGYGIFTHAYKKASRGLKTLQMDQLSRAIELAFDTAKIDLMVMMDCDMLTLDTGYALRDTVKYLVASENALNAVGYNYQAIFKELIKNPDIASEKLAVFVIESYKSKVISEEDKEGAAVFACNLVDAFFYYEMCKKIFALFLAADPVLMDYIKLAKGGAYIVYPTAPLIDFGTFVKLLARQTGPESEITLLCDSLLTEEKQLMPADFIGPVVKETAPGPDLLPRGFSFYFPLGSNMVGAAPQYLETSFTKAVKMSELLAKFRQ